MPYIAAAAAKSLQSCLTLCDTRMAAHQAPPSLGFSRQEYWSGLPFPSSILQCMKVKSESEKWKWSHSVVSDSSRPHGLTVAHQAPPSMGFPRQEYWSGVPLPSPLEAIMYWLFLVILGYEHKRTLHSSWEVPSLRGSFLGCLNFQL